jgi:hypothetical protein
LCLLEDIKNDRSNFHTIHSKIQTNGHSEQIRCDSSSVFFIVP